jgi:hypothetical protein
MKNDQDEAPENGDHRSKLIKAIEDNADKRALNSHLQEIPSFGLWNPNIKDAAELVAVDTWYSGTIEGVNEPEDFDGDGGDSWLIAALADTIASLEAKLSAAVDSGRLKASFVRRSLDEQVIPEETHINYDDLVKWLEERSHEPGDHMSDWVQTECDISDLLCDEVIFLRAARRSGYEDLQRIKAQRFQAKYDYVIKRLDESEQLVEVRAALKAKDGEIFRLKEALTLCKSGRPAKVDRPLHTRQRRTLLTIIAALCEAANIDHTKRGASQRIRSKTELVGAPIDDGTIIKLLEEIPDALETRMK